MSKIRTALQLYSIDAKFRIIVDVMVIFSLVFWLKVFWVFAQVISHPQISNRPVRNDVNQLYSNTTK